MAKQHRMLDDALGAALQTGVPLIVRRRCKPIEQAAWTAIRFLLDTTDRTAFGSREIAAEMHTSAYPRVKHWIAGLVTAEVLEIVGYESVRNLDEPRAIYRIPWKKIYEASLVEAEKSVAGTNRKRQIPAAESEMLQLPLEFPVIDGSQTPVIDGSQTPVIDGSQTPAFSVTHGSQTSVIHGSRWMDGRMDGRGRMDGSRAHRARKREEPPGDPPPVPPPPPAETFAAHPRWSPCPLLTAHPLDLWQRASVKHRPIDVDYLTAMAAEHDASSGGHGWFWVGQAILAAASTEDVYSVAKVRNTLGRWRDEDSYGSDLPSRKARDGHTPSSDDRQRRRGSRAVRSADGGSDTRSSANGKSTPAERADSDRPGADDDDVPAYLRRRRADQDKPAADDDDVPSHLRRPGS